jgi:hypothetical protein
LPATFSFPNIKLTMITWLASYPKSGNTWVRAFLAAYDGRLRGKESFDLGSIAGISASESRGAWFAQLAGKPITDLAEPEINALREPVQALIAGRDDLTGLVKTHNARVMTGGTPLICRQWTQRAVYIVRTPLDVVDSLADHAGRNLDQAIQLMNYRGHRLGRSAGHVTQYLDSWSQHVSSWVNHDAFPVHIVRYEDLVFNPTGSFTQLLRFLNWEISPAAIDWAVQHSSFDSLRQLEERDGFAELSPASREGRFFRRGKRANWTSVLSRSQAETVIDHHAESMGLVRYKIPDLDHVYRERPKQDSGSPMADREPAVPAAALIGHSEENESPPEGGTPAGSHGSREASDGEMPVASASGSLDAHAGCPVFVGDRESICAVDNDTFIAYEIYPVTDMPLTPAPIDREWMDQTQKRFAYRCLPLTIANQAGWVIANPTAFSAVWNGGPTVDDVTIQFDSDAADGGKDEKRISSLFGHGTVTFNMPYLFRTPPDVNLWVKGPTNLPKDGVCALEGLVETDWTAASFTMNWKLTRAGHPVRFEVGEPICMIVPTPRGFLESLSPRRMPLSANAEMNEHYQQWSRERTAFQNKVADGDAAASRRGWQKDYFQGRDPGEERFDSHQTKLGLSEFQQGT